MKIRLIRSRAAVLAAAVFAMPLAVSPMLATQAHAQCGFGRIVSDPSFARREMAAIGMAQMRLVNAGKCVLPKKGSWVSTSRWGIQEHKPMDPIEVAYQDQTYWAHAAYFQK